MCSISTTRRGSIRAGNFHSEALHLVERFTLAGPDHINYEVVVEDPKVFTRPWKMSMLSIGVKNTTFASWNTNRGCSRSKKRLGETRNRRQDGNSESARPPGITEVEPEALLANCG